MADDVSTETRAAVEGWQDMIELPQDAGDDPGYVTEAAAIIQAAVETSAPDTVVVVKIDSWFGSRWLGFSHKVMGAFGVAYPSDLVIPPFVPGRVLSERTYERTGGSLTEKRGGPRLHIEQASEANARRKLGDMYPRAALFWWTAGSQQSGRGALMAYLPTPDGHIGWYAELQRGVAWGFGTLRGISIQELRALRGRSARARIAGDGTSSGS